MTVTCRICLHRVFPEPGKRGRPPATHAECDRVVREHILSKIPRVLPKPPKPRAAPLERCQWCPDHHDNDADRAKCRARAEDSARRVAIR